MTIVMRGLGTDTDVIGSQVAFGLTVEGIGPETTVEAISQFGIENWYAIDFRQRRQFPVNAKQWAVIRGVVATWKRSRRKLLRDTREYQAIERAFTRALTTPRVRSRRTVRDLYVRR